MIKRLLSLLLMLTLLLCAAAGLGEQTPSLSAARISALRRLAGENGQPWREGTPPSAGMDAFQLWQWTDWFLSERVRSLLGALQDMEQLSAPLDTQAERDQWQLRQTESTLARFEAQLEEDRLAILNGIALLQGSAAGDAERQAAYDRVLEAERSIQQIRSSICRDAEAYAAQADGCLGRLQAHYDGYTLAVQANAADGLAQSARALEAGESSSGWRVSALSTHQLGIRVLDPGSSPIPGATVTLSHPLGNAAWTASTDARGDAVFWAGDLGADEAGELRLSLRVEAAGWRTREVQTVLLRRGETRNVYLQEDDGTPYLIMGCFDGRDILTESNVRYCSQENTAKHAFTVKLHCDTAGTLVLRYPTDAAATAYKTVTKPFTAADSDSTVLTFEDQWLRKLSPGAQVSLTINADGKQYTADTLLVLQKAMVETPFLSRSALFSFFSATGFGIPDGMPFIGGSRLSVSIPLRLPQALYLPSHTAMYAPGYDFKPEQVGWQTRDTEDETRAIKAFEVRGKADEALAEAFAHRSINTTAQPAWLDKARAYVTPFAALLGLYRAGDQMLTLRGTGGATLAFDADTTQAFTAGSASFLAGAHLGMDAAFSRDVTSAVGLEVTGGVPKVTAGPQLSFEGAADVPLTLDMRIAGGISDSAVVSLRGYGRLSPLARFTAAGAAVGAGMDMGLDVTLRTLLLKRIQHLRAAKPDLAQPSAPSVATAEESSQMNLAGAEMPLLSTKGISYGSGGVEPAETQQVFRQLDAAADGLQFVQVGTDLYMFWIQPGTNDQLSRLNWFNLNLAHHGDVSHLQGNQTNPKRQKTYTDYAFAVEADGDFCALTILSGEFSKGGSGEAPTPPSEACVATVLMQRNAGKPNPDQTGMLDLIGYRETAVSCVPGEDYPILPGVRLIRNGDALSVLNTCSMQASPQRIDGVLCAYDASYIDQFGKGLRESLSLQCADDARIRRYCIAKTPPADPDFAFYSLDAKGELSRLRGSRSRSREVLAKGDIVSFQVLSDPSGDRLFYLERVKAQSGATVHRLRSVVPGTGTQTDYGIETAASSFDTVRLGEGVYLYWMECSAPDDPGEINAEYLVRCVRYDPGTDTAYGPFSLAELDECPAYVSLPGTGEGFYAVDLQSAAGSYQRLSLSRFTYELIASAALTAAVLPDPCVSAGDYTDLVLSVQNTGNVPLSALDVRIVDTETGAPVQTLHIDLEHPEDSLTNYLTPLAVYPMTGANAVRRIASMYDPLNQEAWTITGSGTRSVRTGLLMPGDARSYQIRLQIPAFWKGGSTLVVQINDVSAEASLSGRREGKALILTGAPRTEGAAQDEPVHRLSSDAAMAIDTDAHDLMLSAQLMRRGDEDYVHITIRNRSGSTASAVTPVLTTSFRGQTLLRHPFANAIGDGFGYSMDIPLSTLTAGRALPELELHVSGATAYEEFADSDNHARLLLATQLCIVRHPVSIPAAVGKPAAFSVTAAGGVKPYRYQWQRKIGADRWEDIPGANQDTYRIASVKEKHSGLTVRCVVTDDFGDSVISNPATLTILPQTGDRALLMPWLLLALASVSALAALCRRRRGQSRQSE